MATRTILERRSRRRIAIASRTTVLILPVFATLDSPGRRGWASISTTLRVPSLSARIGNSRLTKKLSEWSPHGFEQRASKHHCAGEVPTRSEEQADEALKAPAQNLTSPPIVTSSTESTRSALLRWGKRAATLGST